MPRSSIAYLADIVDACDSIASILSGVALGDYLTNREKRSAVEREFIIIGEAIAALRRQSPELASGITHARLIVDFRNVLAHDYAAVDDETVYGLATVDALDLRSDCASLLPPED